MTISITITHNEPNNDRSIYVKKENGNIHEPLTTILPGESQTFYVHSGQRLSVVENPHPVVKDVVIPA